MLSETVAIDGGKRSRPKENETSDEKTFPQAKKLRSAKANGQENAASASKSVNKKRTTTKQKGEEEKGKGKGKGHDHAEKPAHSPSEQPLTDEKSLRQA